MKRPIASLSLDLDNKWAYLRTHGQSSWAAYPSYLPQVVPRILAALAAHDLQITVFVVGQDALRPDNRESLQAIVDAGHEIANHTQNHYPWLNTLPPQEIECEIALAEEAIERATGARPVGFRGPGFTWSPGTLEVLARRGYWYDASTLPMFITPLARLYAKFKTRPSAEQGKPRKNIAGSLRDGLRPLHPYRHQTAAGTLVEIPVTTMPVLRLPFHLTYLLYLRQFSRRLAESYLRVAMQLCRMRGVAPSMLLHPLDFLGGEEVPELAFFPGMKLSRGEKEEVVDKVLRELRRTFQVQPLRDVAARFLGKLASDAEVPPRIDVPAEEPLAVS